MYARSEEGLHVSSRAQTPGGSTAVLFLCAVLMGVVGIRTGCAGSQCGSGQLVLSLVSMLNLRSVIRAEERSLVASRPNPAPPSCLF